MNHNIAVLFPGIGYHKDKPLLYHSGKLAAAHDYKVKSLEFSGFPQKLRGNREALMQSFQIAVSQAEDQLKFIDFSAYDDIVFISKSIGTVAAAVYAGKHSIPARHIYFTPLEQTFGLMADSSGIVFHGTADTWADPETVIRGCEGRHLTYHTFKGLSHSLECEDVFENLRQLLKIMETVDQFLMDKNTAAPI